VREHAASRAFNCKFLPNFHSSSPRSRRQRSIIQSSLDPLCSGGFVHRGLFDCITNAVYDKKVQFLHDRRLVTGHDQKMIAFSARPLPSRTKYTPEVVITNHMPSYLGSCNRGAPLRPKLKSTRLKIENYVAFGSLARSPIRCISGTGRSSFSGEPATMAKPTPSDQVWRSGIVCDGISK